MCLFGGCLPDIPYYYSLRFSSSDFATPDVLLTNHEDTTIFYVTSIQFDTHNHHQYEKICFFNCKHAQYLPSWLDRLSTGQL